MCFLGSVILWLLSGLSCVFFGCDDEFAYAATAAHGVGEVNSVVTCKSVDGKSSFGCRVIAVDRDYDVALLKCDKKHVGEVNCPIVKVSPGESVTCIGYPGGKLTKVDAVVADWSIYSGVKSKRGLRSEKKMFAPGFSGGAVFTESGLAGIFTHSVSDNSIAFESALFADESRGPCDQGACSILDRIIDHQTQRITNSAVQRAETSIADMLPITNPGVRDLIAVFLGWLSRFYFTGQAMVTKVQHEEKLRAATSNPVATRSL